jgi:hypothetical protein
VESACASITERMCSVEMYMVSGSGWTSTREVAGERPCSWIWEAIAYWSRG